MESADVRWPASLWAAVTPPGPDLPELDRDYASRCHRHRRRFHGPVDCAAFARGRRGRRHRRGDGAGLGRIGAQQRAGDPDLVAARPGRHRRQTWGGRRTLRRAVARQRLDLVRCRAALSNSGRAGTDRLGAAGAFARAHQDRRTPGAAMVEIRRAGRVAVARPDPPHAGLGCLVRRLLEQERRPHQSAGAVARSGARGAGTRRPHLCALARDLVRTPERPMGGQNGKGRDQRPRPDSRDQRLYRRILEIADAGHRARSHAGAVLADGDAAAVRSRAEDHHSRPAGDVRYPRRALFRALRCAQSSGHRRRRDRPGQQGGKDQAACRRAPATAVAADRVRRVRQGPGFVRAPLSKK